MKIYYAIFSIFCVSQSWGLIGYDCNTQSANVTTLSLLDVEECDISKENITTDLKYIQLLELNEFSETSVYQCKVEISRTVHYCGMFSHSSIVFGGIGEYIREISQVDCEKAHHTQKYELHHQVLEGLHVNSTSSYSITLAGSVDTTGDCGGVSYSDPFGSWKNVVVLATVKITLKQYNARVSLDRDEIYLASGMECRLQAQRCIDMEGGHTFWGYLSRDHCESIDQKYSVVYEGDANKITNFQHNDIQTVYSLESSGTTFALTAKETVSICNNKIIQTEHPKLLIFETEKGKPFSKKHLHVNNLDIFTYMNSKFIFVEKHIKGQMKQMYRDVITQHCESERQAIKNSLSLATQFPDQFAYDFMKTPGFMAVAAGEVVHIVQCVPVEVSIQPDDNCYLELRVLYKNETFFLTPRTHILKKSGTNIKCVSSLPVIYQLDHNTWYKISKKNTSIAEKPTVIKPLTKLKWKYTSPQNLSYSGIYSTQNLTNLRNRIMFPIEQPGLITDIARKMYEQPTADSENSIKKLFDKDAIIEVTNKLWSQFMNFGTASAGFIAIIMLFIVLKIVFDILLCGYKLHPIFSLPFRLLAAIWSLFSHCISCTTQKPDKELFMKPIQQPV